MHRERTFANPDNENGAASMADPYEILGVKRDATQADIRKAYLRLAKKNHPDLHPGDKAAEARFKEISAANDIVGDEKKRAAFDRGEIDASGAQQQPRQSERGSYRQHAEAGPGFKYERHGANGAGSYQFGHDEQDLFAELFGARAGRTRMRGSDVGYTLSVEFIDAINGAKKRVGMADGKMLDISIPAGLQDGQTLRLRGQGRPGLGGGEPGDVLVDVHVKPHPVFRREGNNIRAILPVTISEALSGGKVPVPTVSGIVQLSVPKGSNTGAVLRLRGKGVPSPTGNGDHLVELHIVLPDTPDDDLVRMIAEWEAKHPYDPRQRQEHQS
jgi:DnaJ-class molecular chaperone